MVTVGTGCKEELGQYEDVVLRYGIWSFGSKKNRRNIYCSSSSSNILYVLGRFIKIVTVDPVAKIRK